MFRATCCGVWMVVPFSDRWGSFSSCHSVSLVFSCGFRADRLLDNSNVLPSGFLVLWSGYLSEMFTDADRLACALPGPHRR
jgi:hypothetical protein